MTKPKILGHISDLNPHVTHADKTAWTNKVDSIPGKGLSENDYTTADKQSLLNKVDKVSGKGLSENDYTSLDKTRVTRLPIEVINKVIKVTDWEGVSDPYSYAFTDSRITSLTKLEFDFMGLPLTPEEASILKLAKIEPSSFEMAGKSIINCVGIKPTTSLNVAVRIFSW